MKNNCAHKWIPVDTEILGKVLETQLRCSLCGKERIRYEHIKK